MPPLAMPVIMVPLIEDDDKGHTWAARKAFARRRVICEECRAQPSIKTSAVISRPSPSSSSSGRLPPTLGPTLPPATVVSRDRQPRGLRHRQIRLTWPPAIRERFLPPPQPPDMTVRGNRCQHMPEQRFPRTFAMKIIPGPGAPAAGPAGWAGPAVVPRTWRG
jgi:hypothetical protein